MANCLNWSVQFWIEFEFIDLIENICSDILFMLERALRDSFRIFSRLSQAFQWKKKRRNKNATTCMLYISCKTKGLTTNCYEIKLEIIFHHWHHIIHLDVYFIRLKRKTNRKEEFNTQKEIRSLLTHSCVGSKFLRKYCSIRNNLSANAKGETKIYVHTTQFSHLLTL